MNPILAFFGADPDKAKRNLVAILLPILVSLLAVLNHKVLHDLLTEDQMTKLGGFILVTGVGWILQHAHVDASENHLEAAKLMQGGPGPGAPQKTDVAPPAAS